MYLKLPDQSKGKENAIPSKAQLEGEKRKSKMVKLSMVLKVFSNLNGSMNLWFCLRKGNNSVLLTASFRHKGSRRRLTLPDHTSEPPEA